MSSPLHISSQRGPCQAPFGTLRIMFTRTTRIYSSCHGLFDKLPQHSKIYSLSAERCQEKMSYHLLLIMCVRTQTNTEQRRLVGTCYQWQCLDIRTLPMNPVSGKEILKLLEWNADPLSRERSKHCTCAMCILFVCVCSCVWTWHISGKIIQLPHW